MWLITNPRQQTEESKLLKHSLSQITQDSFGYAIPITPMTTKYLTTLQLHYQLIYSDISQKIMEEHGLKNHD